MIGSDDAESVVQALQAELMFDIERPSAVVFS
jgi:hypothetical protein